jgi:glucose-1-phosphate cytidylyltransferase
MKRVMAIPSRPHLPKVVLLCGGQGTRMREETEYRPKPMVEVGGKPLLWHIMKIYAAHGIGDFVCCLGYRGSMIKQYFLDYHAMRSDVTVSLASGNVEYATRDVEDWTVSLVDTGEKSMTGARVKRVEQFIGDDDVFMVTYGDGVGNIDITALLDFHRSHGKLATVTGVHPPSRFGDLILEGEEVRSFAEKPAGEGLISGGFFVFDRAVLDRLSPDPSCVLEQDPLESLAQAGELAVYRHDGFWQCADTVREVELLRSMWDRGEAPWRIWDDRLSETGGHPGRRAGDAVEALLTAAARP